MALTPRDRKILQETEDTDEPIFIFRAKDILSLFPLNKYERVVEQFGPSDHEMQMGIRARISEFKDWQHANVGRVKYPD